MPGSSIIDVALGLIFFYVILSLIVTSIQEWIASLLKLRAKTLRKGIARLVGDPLAQQVYQHTMIRNLAISDKRLPSYIDPKTLSAVLLDIVARDQDGKSVLVQNADELKAAVAKIPAGNPIGDVLKTAIAGGDAAARELSDYLAGWFDEGMQRMSGWYRRDAKAITLALAVLLTVATNASTVHVAEKLWESDALRTKIAADAMAAAAQDSARESGQPGADGADLDSLRQFPVGWEAVDWRTLDWPATLLGWLLTVAAISLGAPFWFDLLGKVANLKGAGAATDRGASQRSGTPTQQQ
ncbi:MAG: hypothetical protein RLO01_08115 [Thalassobaculaceae bacterium]